MDYFPISLSNICARIFQRVISYTHVNKHKYI